MTNDQEYREHAAELVRLAQRASSTEDKARLLGMAEAWLDLAARIRTVSAKFRWQQSVPSRHLEPETLRD